MKKIERMLWVLIFVVVISIIFSQGYLWLKIKGVTSDIKKIQKEITVLNAHLADLQHKKREIPQLEQFFKMINSKILLQPEAKNYLDYIINHLDRYTMSYRVDVGSVESVAGQYEIVNINISFDAENYDNAISIIKAIESMEKWTEINSAPSISYVNDGYSVSLTVVIPYVTDISDKLWDIK